jgi:hypothetical protein
MFATCRTYFAAYKIGNVSFADLRGAAGSEYDHLPSSSICLQHKKP